MTTQFMQIKAVVSMDQVGEILALLAACKVQSVDYEVVEIVDRRRKRPLGEGQRDVDLLHLLKGGPITSRELKAKSGLTDSTYYYRIDQLRKHKKIKIKNGKVEAI